MRLIDADALINNLEMLILEQEEDDRVETWNNAITCSIIEVKHHAPTIDAVKHGRWVRTTKADYEWECSACGYGFCDNRTTYCYDCGAKMEVEHENNHVHL